MKLCHLSQWADFKYTARRATTLSLHRPHNGCPPACILATFFLSVSKKTKNWNVFGGFNIIWWKDRRILPMGKKRLVERGVREEVLLNERGNVLSFNQTQLPRSIFASPLRDAMNSMSNRSGRPWMMSVKFRTVKMPGGLKMITYLQMEQISLSDTGVQNSIFGIVKCKGSFLYRDRYLAWICPAVMTAVICFIIWLCPRIHTMLLTVSTLCPLTICAFNSDRSCQSMLTENQPIRRKWTNWGAWNEHP